MADVRKPLFEKHRTDQPFTRTEQEPVERQACPKCSSTAIRPQKQAAHPWRCYGKQRGRTCGHTFDVPSVVLALSPEQKHARSAEWRAHYEASREDFNQRFADEIGKQAGRLPVGHEKDAALRRIRRAVQLPLASALRYLSGDGKCVGDQCYAELTSACC